MIKEYNRIIEAIKSGIENFRALTGCRPSIITISENDMYIVKTYILVCLKFSREFQFKEGLEDDSNKEIFGINCITRQDTKDLIELS